MKQTTAGWALVLVVAGCGGEEKKAPAPDVRPAPAAAKSGGFVEVARAANLRFTMEFLPGEQGERFKINLYDHGSGVAVGDFDGDGFDDVYFLNQLGKNGLFKGDGHGRFTDVSAQSGVALGDRVCLGAVWGDVDDDGDQDLYVTTVAGGNVFFRNEGNGRFADATKEAGLTLVAHSESAAFFDYDGDGDVDLYVTNTAQWTHETRDPSNRYRVGKSGLYELAASPIEHNVLYRNDGRGVFTDVTKEAGVEGPGWGGDMAVFDYDGDGRSDLLVGNMFGSSVLYHNEGGGKFSDVTRAALGRTSWGAVGTRAFDYDGDGRLDLYIVDMHSDMWMDIGSEPPVPIEPRKKYAGVVGPMVERGFRTAEKAAEIDAKLALKPKEVVFGNTLFRNLGGGKFEEVSDKTGAETFWPWGLAVADFDLDGDIDVFLPSGMGYPMFYWPNALLMNRGDGTFEERAKTTGLEPPPDGQFLDSMVSGRLSPKSSRAAAVLDYDGDGRPDLVVGNFNDRAFLYRNEFPAKSWAAFRLQGTKSNRDAIGALVSVTAGGKTRVRQIDTAGGYLAQSTKTAYFGLGDAGKIDAVEIRWPSGLVQKLDAPKVNAINVVVEPR